MFWELVRLALLAIVIGVLALPFVMVLGFLFWPMSPEEKESWGRELAERDRWKATKRNREARIPPPRKSDDYVPLQREARAAYEAGGYRAYLASRYWREVRRPRALHLAGGKCERCTSTDRLEVHHRSYRGVPAFEFDDDLEVLCRSCHHGAHPRAL